MQFTCLPLGQLQTNSYIISKNNEALIIDPGGDANRLIQYLTKHGLNPIAILLTHAHFDHIGAVDDIRAEYQIPVYVHQNEEEWLMDSKLNGSKVFPVGEIKLKPVDHTFDIGETILSGFKFEIIETPGHSPGGVTFVFKDHATLISGDCLFREGIGRTDLIGGDQETLVKSIQKLYQFPDHFKVYSGHGSETTIGYEKRHNPFVRG